MGRWTRDELEREWTKYQQVALQCGPAGDWDPFCDLYTEHAMMVVSGRDPCGRSRGDEALVPRSVQRRSR